MIIEEEDKEKDLFKSNVHQGGHLEIASISEEAKNYDADIAAINELTDEKKIIFDDENNVYDVKLSFAENEIARMIVNHLSNPVEPDYDTAKIARRIPIRPSCSSLPAAVLLWNYWRAKYYRELQF